MKEKRDMENTEENGGFEMKNKYGLICMYRQKSRIEDRQIIALKAFPVKEKIFTWIN